MTYCTYITVHQPTGKYYIGKAETAKVLKRAYKGSGTKLKKAFQKYPKAEWDCGILWEFETSDEAYSDEGQLITEEMLADPLCMNLTLGGEGNPGFKHSPETIAKLKDGASERAKARCEKMGKEKLVERGQKSLASRIANGTNAYEPWWNNGAIEARTTNCPGPGWVLGRVFKKRNSSSRVGTSWWTDGTQEAFTKQKPDDNWQLGRLPAHRDNAKRFAKKDKQ